MARIKIEDLPEDMEIGKEEMKRVMGGMDAFSYGYGTGATSGEGYFGYDYNTGSASGSGYLGMSDGIGIK